MSELRLELRSPWLNAAGSLGFAPDARGPIALAALGAFITNPISAQRRRTAADAVLAEQPEGVWLHSGWPNPGLSTVIRSYAARWARAELPIIVHLLGQDARSLRRMATRVEELENVAAIELGLPPDSEPELVGALCRAAAGELPIIAQLPFERAGELAPTALEEGASVLSLAPPRGEKDSEQSGRLYGPAVFPGALALVTELVGLGAAVIGCGGIYAEGQARAMLKAGAMAVKLDTVLWKVGTGIEEWDVDGVN